MPVRTRLVFYASFCGLFFSGVFYFFFEQFIILKIHAVIGLWFLILFGYLYSSHALPYWRFRRRRLSGFSLLIPLAILIITVPFLYYVANETFRHQVAIFHTYLGFAILLPCLAHCMFKKTSRNRRS